MIKQFINKIIKGYSEHFKKPGNQTLGSLPNLWELELKEMLEEAFSAGREAYLVQYETVINDMIQDSYFMYNTADDYLRALENEQNS